MIIILFLSLIYVVSLHSMDVENDNTRSVIASAIASSSSSDSCQSMITYIQASPGPDDYQPSYTISTPIKTKVNNKWVRAGEKSDLQWSVLLNDKGCIQPGQLRNALVQRMIDSETLICHNVMVYCARFGEKVRRAAMVYDPLLKKDKLVKDLIPPLIKSTDDLRLMYVIYGSALIIYDAKGSIVREVNLDPEKIAQHPFSYRKP